MLAALQSVQLHFEELYNPGPTPYAKHCRITSVVMIILLLQDLTSDPVTPLWTRQKMHEPPNKHNP